jgi:hypothetical protein
MKCAASRQHNKNTNHSAAMLIPEIRTTIFWHQEFFKLTFICQNQIVGKLLSDKDNTICAANETCVYYFLPRPLFLTN